jgi:hypothetical protein
MPIVARAWPVRGRKWAFLASCTRTGSGTRRVISSPTTPKTPARFSITHFAPVSVTTVPHIHYDLFVLACTENSPQSVHGQHTKPPPHVWGARGAHSRLETRAPCLWKTEGTPGTKSNTSNRPRIDGCMVQRVAGLGRRVDACALLTAFMCPCPGGPPPRGGYHLLQAPRAGGDRS